MHPSNAGVSAQYQGDAVQYRPVNISVSIRISSPGNDGPVEQTNLVQVQASVSVEVAQAVQPLAGPLDPTIGVATTVDVAPADGVVAQQEPVDGDGESVSERSRPADIETPTTDILGPTPLDSPFPPSSGPVSPSLGCDITARMGRRPAPVARMDHSDRRASRGRHRRHGPAGRHRDRTTPTAPRRRPIGSSVAPVGSRGVLGRPGVGVLQWWWQRWWARGRALAAVRARPPLLQFSTATHIGQRAVCSHHQGARAARVSASS